MSKETENYSDYSRRKFFSQLGFLSTAPIVMPKLTFGSNCNELFLDKGNQKIQRRYFSF